MGTATKPKPRERLKRIGKQLYRSDGPAGANGAPSPPAPLPRGERGDQVPPGATSTTTPAGIEAHDPDAVEESAEGSGQRADTDGTAEHAETAETRGENGNRRKRRQPRPARSDASLPSLPSVGDPADRPAHVVDLPEALIDANPFQPREDFGASEIESLAESIRQHGQLQPIVVRPVDGGRRYQLVAGERRLRAVRFLNRHSVLASVKHLDDRQAAELSIVENLKRQDLNPIEEARGYQTLLKLSPGLTQEQLGARLGRSQGAIANALRLLELPEPWLARVISGEMPATHARAVLPYAGHAKIAGLLDKRVKERGVPGRPEWERWVDEAVREGSERLTKSVYSRAGACGEYGELRIDSKHPQYADLQVVEVKTYCGKEKRALNGKLARQLLKEKADAWHARHDEARPAKKKQGGAPADPKADQKRLREEAKRAADKQRRDLAEWTNRWRHALLADVIARPDWRRHGELAPMHVAWLLLVGDRDADYFETVLKVAGHAHQSERAFLKLAAAKPAERERIVLDAAVDWLKGCAEPGEHRGWGNLEDDALAALEKLLGIDPARAWAARDEKGRQHFAGDHTEALFALYSDEQLTALACQEWGVGFFEDGPPARAGVTTREAFAGVLEVPRKKPLPLPACVAELLGGKKKAKPKRKLR